MRGMVSVVNLTHTSLETIPAGTFDGSNFDATYTVDLRYNRITTIASHAFGVAGGANFSNGWTVIHLERNRVTQIERGCFAGIQLASGSV